jgi:anthranilate/para-aminobenzoate synthase component I
VPVFERIFSDQLTPVLAYRCLVQEADLQSPSFLLESVVNGNQQGRYSYVGAMPAMEIIATKTEVTVLDHIHGTRSVSVEEDPMEVLPPTLLTTAPACHTCARLTRCHESRRHPHCSRCNSSISATAGSLTLSLSAEWYDPWVSWFAGMAGMVCMLRSCWPVPHDVSVATQHLPHAV